MADSTDDIYSIKRLPLLIILSGPSGVGKDTILQYIKSAGSDFAFVVTMTSRARRPTEVEGKDYFFVSHARFEELIERDELLEHSIVYGEYKGIPKSQVRAALASNKDVIMRIDVQGAEKIKRMVPNAVTIFLMPESEDELVRRLMERKTETEDGMRKRINTARDEMLQRYEFDYVVVNCANHQDKAVRKIQSIIEAEHCRAARAPINL